jgi:hypothetical protein
MQEEALCEPYDKTARDDFTRWTAREKERHTDDANAFFNFEFMERFQAYTNAGFDRRRKDRVGHRDKKASRRINRVRGHELDDLERERKGISEEDEWW